jgi:hypothetical protein
MAMRTLLASLFLTMALSGAAAAQSDARDGRTVDWYGRNPYVRMRVLDQCRNDPGRLRNHPDCINAQRADLADAGNRLTGTYQGSPNTPEWFAHHPDIRRTVLGLCRNMNADAKRQYGACEPARQSIVNDQLRLTGRLPPEVSLR